MKLTKTKFIQKVFAVLVALVFVFLVLPVSELYAYASTLTGTSYVDYSYLTIGKTVGTDILSPETSKYTGQTYQIMMAYVGGDTNYGIGRLNDATATAGNSETVTFTDSSVTVSYGGTALADGKVTAYEDTDAAYENYYGYFELEKVGTYTITYSYSYYIGSATEDVVTNYYDFTVTSYINEATIDLDDNDPNFLPEVIDYSLYQDVMSSADYEGVVLPLPTVYDEDGEEIESYSLLIKNSSLSEADYASGDYIILSASAGANDLTEDYLKLSSDSSYAYIDKTALETYNNYVTYTITYAYYHDGEFVTKETKSTTVYDSCYTNYSSSNLDIELESSLTTSAQPGVEVTIPAPVVTTNSKVTLKYSVSSSIDVYYKVAVKYQASSSKSWTNIQNVEVDGVKIYEDVVDENGYLIDETAFTPLQAGSYTFVYTIYDFYGNEVTTADGRFYISNITDSTNPTPVVYDPSDVDADGNPTYEDASSKLASYSYVNGVVIYAITATDNLSAREDISVSRVVMLGSEELFSISGYDAYNLVFNYASTTGSVSTSAYQNLVSYNYYIRQKLADSGYTVDGGSTTDGYAEGYINSDADMLSWLKANGYRIVIDNANASTIYEIFTSLVSTFDSSIVDGDTLLAYAKSADENTLADYGFAYVNADKTFGSKSGYGANTYTVRYVAEDEAGNSAYTSISMQIATSVDEEAPEVTFSTTLDNIYLTDDTVSFTAPTASDDKDDNMIVKTYYRFINSNGAITGTIQNVDGEDIDNSFDSTTIINYLITSRGSQTYDSNGVAFTTKYAAYEGAGYIDLTDSSLSTYSIDLSEFDLSAIGATGVQIIAYAIDDAGNIEIAVQNFSISTVVDTMLPSFSSISFEVEDGETEPTFEYDQLSEITLPSVTIKDDHVDYVSYSVNVYYLNGTDRQEISAVSGATQTYNTKRGTFTVNAGSFIAPFKGEYLVTITFVDSANNTIATFLHYTTNSIFIVQDPTISVSISEDTLELDENPVVKLPTPVVNYTIDDSIDYETYASVTDWTGSVKPQYVVVGVDEDGYATNYTTTQGEKASFSPSKVGTYDIVYSVYITVYDNTKAEYVEGSVSESNYDFDLDYYTLSDISDIRIQTVENNSNAYIIYYNISGSSADSIVVTMTDGEAEFSNDTNNFASACSAYDEDYFTDIFNNVIVSYTLVSDTYTVVVKDTQGPTIKDYNYPESISADEIAATYSLTVYGIEAEDASGLNISKSTVTVTTSYISDGQTRPTSTYLSGEEKLNGKTVSCTHNGTITITYTVYDNAGNSTPVSYTINAGDNQKPLISYAEGKEETDVVETSYTLSEVTKNGLSFNVEYLVYTDASGIDSVEYVLVNEDSEEIDAATDSDDPTSLDSKVITYDIDEVGTYTFTVTVTDVYGNYQTLDFTVEITEDETDATLVYQIVGTILIVISVLLLAGVIIYFIVSKVKLDKELKKSI